MIDIVDRLIAQVADVEEFEFVSAIASRLPVEIIGHIMGVETLSAKQLVEIRKDAEDAGDQLTAEEALALCVLLLVAGNETTTGLLCKILVSLRSFPDQERLVRNDLSLVPNLTEETLRYLSPTQVLFRRATGATEICGVAIPKDSIVLPIYGSANRDETIFARPDQLDVTRTDLRQHMAFGWGIHLCVGRALALLKSELAIKHLFKQFRTIDIVEDNIDWCDTFYLRCPRTFTLRWVKHG
ncbi:MAG: cytochrome P450 [Gammaproteobacteria bacterium]